MKRFFGIADSDGIESFIEYESEEQFTRMCSILKIRAQANQQRFATIYVVHVTKEVEEIIQEYLKVGNFSEALKILKKYSTDVMIERNSKMKWEMIPFKKEEKDDDSKKVSLSDMDEMLKRQKLKKLQEIDKKEKITYNLESAVIF